MVKPASAPSRTVSVKDIAYLVGLGDPKNGGTVTGKRWRGGRLTNSSQNAHTLFTECADSGAVDAIGTARFRSHRARARVCAGAAITASVTRGEHGERGRRDDRGWRVASDRWAGRA